MTNQNTETSNPATAELQAIDGRIWSVPDQFIDAMREGLQAYAVHQNVQEAIITGTGAAALADDVKVHDLEPYLPNRRRARGTMATAYVAPFAQYATAYAEPGAAVFVDAEHMAATAVLDLGTKETPGHTDHRAKLQPSKTAPYTALLAINGRLQSQQALAEFIEDWGALARLQFFNADGEISNGKALAAVRRITIENLRKVDSEEQQLSANRTAFESVKASSQEPIPTTIYYTCKPYADLEERTFVLRISIITGDKAPSLVLRIQNLEAHVEEMGKELAKLVQTAISGAMPVLLGSYSKAQ
ncbi:MAG: DUF2303 family protein [Acidovorax sp.]|uniref:DUF2303 family protein n=1 Tax=Acidovorax sp. TaxID=1872122 RepID=UPI00391AB98F